MPGYSKSITVGVVVIVIVSFFLGYLFVVPPRDFPIHKLITVEKDLSVVSIAESLESDGVITSPKFFSLLTIALGSEKKIVAGDYYFSQPASLFEIIRRLTGGVYGLTPITVTLPEGETSENMAKILEKQLPRFDKEEFLNQVSDKEGFLFPDTYFFYQNTLFPDVINKMEANFETKIASLKKDIEASKKTLNQIITMASIVEAEARTKKDRQIVAGILWKRIDRGMPLQVDAPFAYITNKSTYELTREDLRRDSPYNTYTRKGLPPTPINNPGAEAINASLHPLETEYFYYLSDKKGNMYYARDYSEHLRNKRLYLSQ